MCVRPLRPALTLQTLLDLMGEESTSMSAAPSAASRQTTQDLLADIFGGGDAAPAASVASPAAPAPSRPVDDIMGLFGSTAPAAPAPTPAPPPAASTSKSYTAYDANGLRITLAPQQDSQNASVVNMTANFASSSPGGVQGINFQAAVPKVRRAI